MCASAQACGPFQQTKVGLTIMSATRALTQSRWASEGGARDLDFNKMKYAKRRAAFVRAGALWVAIVLTVSGCAGRWFEPRPRQADSLAAAPNAPTDLKSSTVAYVRGLCALPRDQRDAQLRELNESVLPNHATVSCGPGGFSGE